MKNRKEEIKKKGFSMNLATDIRQIDESPYNPVDYSKIRVGLKTLEDAVFNLNAYKKIDARLGDKSTILDAINSGDYDTMREASNFFFKTSGIYNRLCRYLAYLFRYDWMVTPYYSFNNSTKIDKEKILGDFYKALRYLDNFEIKKFFGEVALKVIRDGAYYGYLIPTPQKMMIQELPVGYCRSRFQVEGRPAVEFNMKYFDETFRDTEQRMKILKLFPKEFAKGYALYKQGKLPAEFMGDTSGWYLLEVKNVVKFNLNGEDFPAFISVIPTIIDLAEAQALDKKKMQQKLLKIIIQKMPLDKNGELIFDIDEAQALHNNVVKMLAKAIGVDVLTTFADVEVADMADKNTTTTVDDLMKVERSVYNEAGVSQNQFNTDGNIALEKSILNDEASMYTLISQFEEFLNILLEPFNKKPKKVYYQAQLLTTTIYNYKDMSKLYKEQMQVGFSKMLPQIALGQSQSSILANAYFENDILDLVHVFIPPLMSSTMNAEVLGGRVSNTDAMSGEEKEVGRKEKADDEKSEKTILNRESMS